MSIEAIHEEYISRQKRRATVGLVQYFNETHPEDVLNQIPKKRRLDGLKIAELVWKERERKAGQGVEKTVENREAADYARFIVGAGIRDASDVLRGFLEEGNDEAALEVVRDPRTVETIARLALRSTEELEDVIHEISTGGICALNDNENYIDIVDEKILDKLSNTDKFCPYAGRSDRDTGDVSVAPTPLFTNFVGKVGEYMTVNQQLRQKTRLRFRLPKL